MGNISILLAEDSDDDVFFFRRGLQKSGLTADVHVVENGRRAIEYLSQQRAFSTAPQHPDVIFIDLKMPEVDGFELLEWIGKNYETPPFETIVLTSSDEPRDYKRALDLGARGYFLKPISPEQLASVLTRVRVAAP